MGVGGASKPMVRSKKQGAVQLHREREKVMGRHKRKQIKLHRENRAVRIPEILKLRDLGFDVVDLNLGQQFRIDGKIDLYPGGERFYVLVTNQRGSFTGRQILSVVRDLIGVE